MVTSKPINEEVKPEDSKINGKLDGIANNSNEVEEQPAVPLKSEKSLQVDVDSETVKPEEVTDIPESSTDLPNQDDATESSDKSELKSDPKEQDEETTPSTEEVDETTEVEKDQVPGEISIKFNQKFHLPFL